jgi:hypothetical protein
MEAELLAPPPAKRRRRKPKPPTPLQLAKERHKAVRAARAEEYAKKVFRAYENARLTTRPTREIRDIQSAAYALYDGGFKGWLVATTLGISIAHARTLLSYWRNGRSR